MGEDTLERVIKEQLMSQDEEFKRLAIQHRDHSERLDQLSRKPFLSESEKVEEVTLKKKKLHLKDQMQGMINRYRQQKMV